MSKTVAGKKYIKYVTEQEFMIDVTSYEPPQPTGTREEFFIGEPFNLYVELDGTSIIDIGRAIEPRIKYNYTSIHQLTVKPQDVDIPFDWVQMCDQYLLETDELKKFREELGVAKPIIKLDHELMNEKHAAGIDDINSGNYDDGIAKFTALIEAKYSIASSEYNIACCYSLKKMIDESVDYFKRAVDHGYTNWIHAILDDDLVDMINDPRTVTIIKGLMQDGNLQETIVDSFESGELTTDKEGVLNAYFTAHEIESPFLNGMVLNSESGGETNDNEANHLYDDSMGLVNCLNSGTLPVSNSIMEVFQNMQNAIKSKLDKIENDENEHIEDNDNLINEDSIYDESIYKLLCTVMPKITPLLKTKMDEKSNDKNVTNKQMDDDLIDDVMPKFNIIYKQYYQLEPKNKSDSKNDTDDTDDDNGENEHSYEDVD